MRIQSASLAPVAALCLALGLSSAGAETIRVSGPAELRQALSAAQGGDRILLADGDYGELFLKDGLGRYDRPVTVVAEHRGGARFDAVRLREVANLNFEGIAVTAGFASAGSRGVGIAQSTGEYLFFRDSTDVSITDNTFSGGDNTLTLWSVAGFTIARNHLSGARSDLVQISRASHDGRIEDNALIDVAPVNPKAHPDLIQLFGHGGETPHDITIRGNFLHDDLGTGKIGAQGIFLSDPQKDGFRNILIEENMLGVRHPNTIFVAGGRENVVIRNNSLIAGFTSTYRGGTIRLAGKGNADNSGVTVEGNIAAGLIDETRDSRIGRNLFYPEASAIFSGPGVRWQDFLLRNPGRFQGLGAEKTIAAHQAGLR